MCSDEEDVIFKNLRGTKKMFLKDSSDFTNIFMWVSETMLCIARTEKGTQCSRRCIQCSDMCKVHNEKYEKCDIIMYEFMYEWFNRATIPIPRRWRPIEFRRAASFIGDIDNSRNLAEVRRNMEARMLEIGKRVAARRIANTWRRVNADPNYRVCRDRLMREFSDMC